MQIDDEHVKRLWQLLFTYVTKDHVDDQSRSRLSVTLAEIETGLERNDFHAAAAWRIAAAPWQLRDPRQVVLVQSRQTPKRKMRQIFLDQNCISLGKECFGRPPADFPDLIPFSLVRVPKRVDQHVGKVVIVIRGIDY